MSEQSIDDTPAESGQDLIDYLRSEFGQLNERIGDIERELLPSQPSLGITPSSRVVPSLVAATDTSDPIELLKKAINAITSAQKPLSDSDIGYFLAICKQAIRNLRGDVGGAADSDTIAKKLAIQAEVRDLFITAIGGLLDAARSRDPYAAQLQIP